MIKWVAELQEYSFTFLVESSTWASLANLLTYKDSPILVKCVEEQLNKIEEKVLENAYTMLLERFKKGVSLSR